MSIHQVITGALNDCEHAFSVGSVDGVNFITCAVGSDVVILAPNFERVQIIPGCSSGSIIGAVSSCTDSGKIAAVCGNHVVLYDPTCIYAPNAQVPYKWTETYRIDVQEPVNAVQWVLDGLRLLVLCRDKLILYQHEDLFQAVREPVKFELIDAANTKTAIWKVLWHTKMSLDLKLVKFSYDGTLFATTGHNDNLVKIWYQDESVDDNAAFSFIYLQHPAPVIGFEWRRTSRYMPKKCVHNSIITWCEDDTSRIWKQIPKHDSQLESLIEAVDIVQRSTEKIYSSRKTLRIKKARRKLVSKIQRLIQRNARTKQGSNSSGTGGLSRSGTFTDFAVPAASADVLYFSLVATIDASNDCLLVPSLMPTAAQRQPFAIHWLNNKDLIFANGVEKMILETIMNDRDLTRSPSKDCASPPRVRATITEGVAASSSDAAMTERSNASAMSLVSAAASTVNSCVQTEIKDLLDSKIENLLRQWNKSIDVVFSVYPIDGSLLTWTIEYLDDPWRQPVVNFASRFPNAFSLTDAASLNLSLYTFNPRNSLYIELSQRGNPDAQSAESMDKFLRYKNEDFSNDSINLLTSHFNGSLNLWDLTTEKDSDLTHILNITHQSRMCGHRFHISRVVAHPVLPLLLTASHSHKNDDHESELVMWKVAPVGPLCKSGGVRELARLSSRAPAAFDCISWVPAILPSWALGTVCNSPSSCFIASNEGQLCIYQAVVDARGLIAELYSSKKQALSRTSSESSLSEFKDTEQTKLTDTFNVVSTQSTSRPGCVLSLGSVESSNHISTDMLMLHVFSKQIAINNIEANAGEAGINDRSHATFFSDDYYVVMVVRTPSCDRIKMWSLNISSQPPVLVNTFDEDDKAPTDASFYPTANSSSQSSAAKLSITTKLVYDEGIVFPNDARIVSCVVSAGHLPSASLYPACRAPYPLSVSCNDDSVRFLRCSSKIEEGGRVSYTWNFWKMINDNISGDIEMDGEIYALSCAHTGRFATAHKSYDADSGRSMAHDLEVAIFECESSGGVEWLKEDSFNLEKYVDRTVTTRHLLSSFDRTEESYNPNAVSDMSISERIRRLVRLDWVSAEDGSHILTVGVGHTVYLFSQVSANVAQQNIVMMKDNETRRRGRLRKASSLVGNMANRSRLVHWICIRTLELVSADGLPPLPTAMSWVRDGMLIVGLHSEMRIYDQWNLTSRAMAHAGGLALTNGTGEDPAKLGQKPSINISRSHSMLEQLSKRAKHDYLGTNKIMLEIITKVFNKNQGDTGKEENMLNALSEEGLFEASRLANPMLPQYHPKQLMEMLNSGKTKRVKAILLHVIRTLKRRSTGSTGLKRGTSTAQKSSLDALNFDESDEEAQQSDNDDGTTEYEELGNIPPLPLFALLEADNAAFGHQKAENLDSVSNNYESLFQEFEDEDNLDDVLNDTDGTVSRRSRISSCSSDPNPFLKRAVDVSFTTKHCRILTDLLTHMHLPGLSSVDQMHLLSVADTLSHFASSSIDRLTQVNAAFRTANVTTIADSAAAGYANVSTSVESVDDCGLRFLMAMKQHEYLLRCLPMNQRTSLNKQGLSTAHIIWAFHSDTETELLNSIPCCQKGSETWEELRSFGIAWWLKNTTTLRLCVEKMAKAAFQQKQDPMDASLYYLALRKKNVLTHLFKTIRDEKMANFFREDFSQERWKKAALKNAFVLMSKQRFHHAAAFFLLGDCLKDAIQTILRRLNDIQLAMVILRVFETDAEKQSALMAELLCGEILGVSPEQARRHQPQSVHDSACMSPHGGNPSRDPFERSMAYWIIKNYAKSASTFLEEANRDTLLFGDFTACSLSDIFNLYSFLRKHPLVVRQRLTDANIQIGSTERFLQLARELENRVTPSERRLFFKTATVHMTSGCPLLALDVLLRLPNKLASFLPDDDDISLALDLTGQVDLTPSPTETQAPAAATADKVDDFDWSAPVNAVKDDELKLDWSDEENEDDSEFIDEPPETSAPLVPPALNSKSGRTNVIDFISQHLKYIASLRVFMEELATLASGFEVDGGQLRYELFRWLENECVVLRDICDYQMDTFVNQYDKSAESIEDITTLQTITLDELHDDEQNSFARTAHRRRLWLFAHQKLIRTFTSYCALHSAQNYRLTSVLMELLLLLLELQQEKTFWNHNHVNAIPKVRPFPLLVGSLSTCRMFLSSPLHFIENQSNDLLLTISEMQEPLSFGLMLPKVYELYNLCQGLSSCLYQSLSDIDNFCMFDSEDKGLKKRYTSSNANADEILVVSSPDQWPGVQAFLTLLECEKDEDVPNLQLLLAECYTAITMSLFCYAFSLHDSHWLYRLLAKEVTSDSFGIMFGGAGEQKLSNVPSRPPPPKAPVVDSNRVKQHAKVFGPNVSMLSTAVTPPKPVEEPRVTCWVPPKKHVVQFYAEKVQPPSNERESEYDSDDAMSDKTVENYADEYHVETIERPHDCPNSFAWQIMRLALAIQQLYRLKQFLRLLNVDLTDLSSYSPKIYNIVRLLERWIEHLKDNVESFPGGCPATLLPSAYIDSDLTAQPSPLLQKYRSLMEAGNTPFEYDAKGVVRVRRLWSYLVKQEHLSAQFIKYIFENPGTKDLPKDVAASTTASSTSAETSSSTGSLVTKIVQREHEPIVAFAINNACPSRIAVSTSREIQEMNLESLFEEQENLKDSRISYLNNRVALDIAVSKTTRDTLRDNDDYQVLFDAKIKTNVSFIKKHAVGGVRCLESHPTLPYYVSGSFDGSILLWEWGHEQPLFTARSAGQYAKVTKLAFALNGNKFAAVDGDGLLCMWQATQSRRKPFFNQKSHTKVASDVKFLAQTSSLLVTAGHSTGDTNVSLWDTLMPASKCNVHSFVGHPDGAMCVAYIPNNQTIVSGGRHGDVCLWDIRQRQLRASVKAFDSTVIVKDVCIDSGGDYIIVGSSDGDLKIFGNDLAPVSSFMGEHAAKGGFSLRQVGIQGVQQLCVDSEQRLYSCGADCSLKFRPLMSVVNTYG